MLDWTLSWWDHFCLTVFLSFIRVVVQGRRANMPENPRGLREVSQCSIFSTARWCIFEPRLILPIQGYPCPGFLICVPMQEEWASEEGVKVLDGWSFQVIVQHYSSRVLYSGLTESPSSLQSE
jgi:hypothetical protein